MNHETFAVGEVAILHTPGRVYHGEEVTVVGPLELRRFRSVHTGKLVEAYAYDVDGSAIAHLKTARCNSACARPENLRKKRPPQEEDARTVVKWSECPWQPSGIAV